MMSDVGVVTPGIGVSCVHRSAASRPVGTLLIVASAVAFSTAGLFTRLSHVDVWTMLFWRGLLGGLLILAYVGWRERGNFVTAFVGVGCAGLVVAGCSTIGTSCFICALRQTTVADVTVIYALAPFMAAAIAWGWMRERPDRVTLLASALALIGVVTMCGAGVSTGRIAGELLALAMTALMALMMVVIRVNRHVSMLSASCLSALACSALVLPIAHPSEVSGAQLGLLALFGVFQFGLGLLLLTLGSRLISATRASLLANLELPFAPLWVWLAFGEVPAPATWLGGGIIGLAVLLDIGVSRPR